MEEEEGEKEANGDDEETTLTRVVFSGSDVAEGDRLKGPVLEATLGRVLRLVVVILADCIIVEREERDV